MLLFDKTTWRNMGPCQTLSGGQMLKKLLATTALCAIPFASYAADLPVRQPVYKAAPVVAAPVYNWTGFYIGGNVGYSWGRSDVTLDSVEFFGFGASTGGAERLHPNGIIGGLQAGYNLQSSRNWVWGVETDFQWTGQKKRVLETATLAPPSVTDFPATGDTLTSGSASATVTSKLTWLGTLRGRVGFVPDANPGMLFYATGGLAYGRVKTSFDGMASGSFTNTTNCEGGCTFSGAVSASGARTKVGWTIGAGVEGDLGNLWTWKVEYLYVDLGTVSGTIPVNVSGCVTDSTPTTTCTSATGIATYSNRMTDNIVRVGINRRFGGP
jgi:outer membrane immunogenic protein